MACPNCGNEEYEILKSKGKKVKQLTLQCKSCSHVYRQTLQEAQEVEVRVVISEFENSWKSSVKLYSDEYLEVGTVLFIDDKEVEVTSIENTDSIRVYECPVINIQTIWAKSLDTLARLGISIDNHGEVLSHKIEIEREFIFTIGDVCEIDGVKFKIYGFKTLERSMKKGYAYAKVIKRVYGKLLPRNDRSTVQYDLTEYVIKTTIKEHNY